MAVTITPGFTGWARAGSNPVRFASCSLNAVQTVEAPDLVMGDYTHNAWAYGKIEVGGQLSGPMTESTMAFVDYVWSAPRTIELKYYGGYRRNFTGMLANSLTINVNAGEVVNFTLDFLGTGFSSTALAAMDPHTESEKLLTWDKAAMYYGTQSGDPDWGTVNTLLSGLQSFSITITNNVSRQFAIRGSDLFGDLVRGMSAVSGQAVSYELKSTEAVTGSQFGEGAEHWDTYDGDDYYPIKIDLGGTELRCTVVWHRATSELSTGPVLTTMGFDGIAHWGGENPFASVHNVFS
jgi:hypothetical protein